MSDGLVRLVQRIDRIAATRGITVRIGTQATTGKRYLKSRGGWITESRSATDNLLAFRTNAKEGRDINTPTDAERRRVSEMWTAAVHSVVKGQSASAIERAATDVGRYIVTTIREHVTRREGADGTLRAVTPSTQRQKDRETQKSGLPPMRRTGQLLRSLVATVRKV